MIITSKNNPLIKETALLKDKKGRKLHGSFLVEGIKMSREVEKSELFIERVFITETLAQTITFPEEKTVVVSEAVMRCLSDEKTPQGVVCRVRLPRNELTPPKGACIVLDGVADPGNVGTIIRTANAAGYDEIYLTDDCADAYAPKSVRASMSGIFFTKPYIAPREEIVAILQGTPIVIADMQGENVFEFTPPSKFALVIGNEANGVSSALKTAAQCTVKIPMRKTQESLNAAVSAGILMYQLKKEL